MTIDRSLTASYVDHDACAVRAAQATFHLHLALLDRLVPRPRIAPRPQEAVA